LAVLDCDAGERVNLGWQGAAGHEDGSVSIDISRASCRTGVHESPSCLLWQIRYHFNKYKDMTEIE
jgi:hypothetical protein